MKLIHSGRRIPASASGGEGGVLQHPLQWVVEPLMAQPSYLQRTMFGCLGCYLHGRLMLVLAARREPWQGLLMPTAREHHATLLREEGGLVVHPVLTKWLYLMESSDTFEEAAQRLVDRVLANDPRLGVEPSSGSPRTAKKAPSVKAGRNDVVSQKGSPRSRGCEAVVRGSRAAGRGRSKRPK
jgi:hypothetical protein